VAENKKNLLGVHLMLGESNPFVGGINFDDSAYDEIPLTMPFEELVKNEKALAELGYWFVTGLQSMAIEMGKLHDYEKETDEKQNAPSTEVQQ